MYLFYLYFALLLRAAQNREQADKTRPTETKIVKAGTDVIIKCQSCNVDHLAVSYKAPNGGYEIIKARGQSLSRSKIHDRINYLYDLIMYECAYHLFLSEVQFSAAGVFSCWEGSVITKTTNLIVTSSDTICFAIPESANNRNIFLKTNESISIICPFQYSADESCIVTPIWTDLTGYRNLTIPGDDFKANMDNKHAWLSFRFGADIKNGTHFDLHFVFDCPTFSNYSQGQNIRQHGMYYFGQVPFTLILENKTGSLGGSENKKTDAYFIALLVGASTTLTTIAAVLLIVVGVKTLCYAKSQTQIMDYKEPMTKMEM